jgi:hypothetical protein
MYSKEINFDDGRVIEFDFACNQCGKSVKGRVLRPIQDHPTDTTVTCCGKIYQVDVLAYDGGVNGVFYVQGLNEKDVVNIKMV